MDDASLAALPPTDAAARSIKSFISAILNVPCSSVNGAFDAGVHTLCVKQLQPTEQWLRIKEAISKKPKGAGREEAWLAVALETNVQVVHNWTTRGIPTKEHASVAKALGWSIEELLDDEAATPSEPWPFGLISRAKIDALDDQSLGVVQSAMFDALERLDAMRQVILAGAPRKQAGPTK